MSTARAFKPLDIKRIKGVVDEVAKDNNVPTLSFPTSGEGVIAAVLPEEPAAVAATDISPPATRQKAVKKSAPAAVKRVAVDMPDYLVRAIKKRAMEDDVTIRFLYLTAFRAAGFTVNDVDMMEDGRREA